MVLQAEFMESFQDKTSAKVAYMIGRCLFTLIDFQMPTKVWSRTHVNFKTLSFKQIKLVQLHGKIVKCVFDGYSKGGKGYKLQNVKSGGSKFFINKCITFSVTHEGGRVET